MAFPQPSGQGRAAQLSLVAALSSWLSGTDVAELAREMLPTVEDSSWRLEHTVDAVSGAFEYYLSWVVGIVVEKANTQLESASAPVRRRQEVAALMRSWRIDLGAGPREVLDLLEFTRARRQSLYARCLRAESPRVLLRSKTPAMVEQEFWAMLCVYQAIRELISYAAPTGLDPGRVSFNRAFEAARDSVTRAALSPQPH